MDIVLVLFYVLLVVFLAILALIYLTRPQFFTRDDEPIPDIDLWLALIFSLVIAFLTVLVVAILISKYCGDVRLNFSLRDVIAFNLRKSTCPRV